MKEFDVVIIGSGASGLNLALNLMELGIKNLLIVEKDPIIGGRLNTATYNISKNANIIGVEYKDDLLTKIKQNDIQVLTNTLVTKIDKNTLTVSNSLDGIFNIMSKVIVLCNGSKEKGINTLNIDSNRPSGIFTTIATEKILNSFHALPGKNVSFLGFSNTGKEIFKILKSKGVNISSIICNDDLDTLNDIPTELIYKNYKLVKVNGNGRLTSIEITNNYDKKVLSCDTLILSEPAIPDSLLAMRSNIPLENGVPILNENFQTKVSNIFVIGNAAYIHNSIEEIELNSKKVSYIIFNTLK